MKLSNPLKLFIAILVSQLAGIIGALFTMEAIPTWYAQLARPEIAPPNWVFGPVWTTLYTLMGISAFLVWKKGLERRDVRMALIVFGIHLVFNTLWSIIFFGFQELGWALAEISVLWIFIVATMFLFYRIHKVAAYLLIPYLLWVSFASYLNYSFWVIN
jgi:tryptophan-rich sensory protein